MNTLIATIEFDYKGEHHKLSALINVDSLIDHDDFYQSACLMVAKENNIGLYTYELEIMMDQNIVFSDEKGYVVGCVNNGIIDLDKLKQLHTKHLIQPHIHSLVEKYGLVDDKDIVKALTDADIMGKNA